MSRRGVFAELSVEVDEDGKFASGFRTTTHIVQFCLVMKPEDSAPPILNQTLRSTVHQWLTEFGVKEELEAMGVKPRMRGLFYGPPGTGKTTLAHHIGARLGLPLVLVDGAALRSQWVGQTGQQIVALFRDLRRQADKCVVLFDEFDALAPKRLSAQASDREAANIVNALLQHFDRYDGLLIAASNRDDIIDPALWRRFDTRMEIGFPDDECRFAILKRYFAPLDPTDDDLDVLVPLTQGASPALLRQLAEGIKRDLVIAPRVRQSVAIIDVFNRVLSVTGPGENMPMPPLWEGRGAAALRDIVWPFKKAA